jgi:hypothetical protein
MTITRTYSIDELLKKNTGNKDLQNLDWDLDLPDLEFNISSILGGDWEVDKDNKTVTEL